jgi:FG-GAP-like repeat
MQYLPRRRCLAWMLLFLVALATLALLPADEPRLGAAPRFTEHLIQDGYGYSFGIAAADIDGDGKPDVVVVKNQAAEIVWFRNNGTPRDDKPWKKYILAKDFPRAYDVTVADFDGDGHLDVAASAWVGNQFAVFRNDGKPLEGKLWTRFTIDEKVGETRTIRAGDFSRDGKPDLLGTARTGNLVAWYENPGKLDQPWKKLIIDDKSVSPAHGHPVDLDGDGDLDVVMALGFNAAPEAGQVVWYENVGKPGDGKTWKKHVLANLPGAFEAFAADIDGDGKLDIVASAWGGPGGGRVVWLQNPGDPKKEWKMHGLKANWPRANQVLAVDLNGDKRLDVIAGAERGANEVRWWRNEGK